MPFSFTRREFVSAAAAFAAPQNRELEDVALENNDKAVEASLRAQVTDPANRSYGAYQDQFGIAWAGTAGGLLHNFVVGFLHPRSRYYKQKELLPRMKLAAGFLERAQSPQGFIDLLTTNFDSPPDTGFVVHGVASAACLAKRAKEQEVFRVMVPFLNKAGAGLAVGGVHTPNHRWVVCQALAQIDEVLPNPAYRRRIDQWLAEGIDIDEEGQYTERSTSIYNSVVNRALTTLAIKLNRPELLDPVRRNLEMMLYMLHADWEVVTEISGRQDKDLPGNLGRNWFPYRLLAVRDNNGQFTDVEVHHRDHASLGELMQYPELLAPGPAPKPVPANYEKIYPINGYARIRRGQMSATLLLRNTSKFLAFRNGGAVVDGVRMAGSFFGRGMFTPALAQKRKGAYHFEQTIQAGYFQPLDPPRRVTTRSWYTTRNERRMTEACELRFSADVSELRNGLQLKFAAAGTKDVPITVEFNFRPNGTLEGCKPAPEVSDAYLLGNGYGTYRNGPHAMRFGPGLEQHAYTQLHRLPPKLAGKSVYLTAFSPFEHTINFEWL
jgi:hypothetical protein